ncbi:MAG: acyltransferase domain-containing protein, partial [Gammaproteobacteria bacterium]
RASAGTPPRVAFLFTGQGAQYPGMGQPLYTHEPVFRDTLDACADHLAPLLPGDLRAHLYPQPGQPDRLHETWLTQPALFAVEYALARLWQSWGITPAAVLGHSVGEYVAACVAGVFSLEDALTLIATRARLMNELPRGGAMAAVRLSETDLRTRLAAYGDALTLAALNGPQHYTVSGDEAALTDLVARLTADQIGVQRLSVSHAFHSAHMQPMVAAYRDVLRRITFAPPRLPLIANVTGLPLGPNELNADYWIQHLLKPVRFADSLRYLHQDGIRTYLEVGPKATLLGLARATLPPDSLLLTTLQPPETPWHSLYDSLAQLYVRGAPVDTRALDRGRTRRKLPLPTYPFERQRCWFETAADRADPTPETQTPMNATLSPSTLTTHHPLLDTAPAQRDGSHHLYAIRLTADQPVVRDHRVQGNAILPGVAYLELALAAAERHSQHPHTQLNHLLLTAPLAAEADGSCQARVRLLPNDAGGLGFVVEGGAPLQAPPDASVEDRLLMPDTPAFRLESNYPGMLNELTIKPAQRRTPAANEVEIEVYASGINFMDLMNALGILPTEIEQPVPLGVECAGKVVAVGDAVQGILVGDEVIAATFRSSTFSRYTTTYAHLVVLKPKHLSFEEAATIPVVFLTVYYAFYHLAKLKAGERVLIHSAAGGVGLAAIQMAKAIGAEIFVTSGTEDKRDFLRTLGVTHVMDSRSMHFVDEIMAATGGQGVDVVLNSLAGDFISNSLLALAPYGRFIEIGKTDIYQNNQIGLYPFRRNLSYFAVDMDRMARERPALVGTLFKELIAYFETKTFEPCPLRVYPLVDAPAAFRYMMQRKHVGKMVLQIHNTSLKRHATGDISLITLHAVPKPLDLAAVRQRCPRSLDIDELYAR